MQYNGLMCLISANPERSLCPHRSAPIMVTTSRKGYKVCHKHALSQVVKAINYVNTNERMCTLFSSNIFVSNLCIQDGSVVCLNPCRCRRGCEPNEDGGHSSAGIHVKQRLMTTNLNSLYWGN